MKAGTPRRTFALILAGSVAALLGLAPATRATSGTWLDTGGTDGQWSTTSNWVSGTVPGATSGTTNTDTATFNTALGTFGTSGSPILIDANRNISGISFDTAAGNYFIGTAGGNSLLVSAAGAIQILNTLTATNAVATVNAPLIIEGASGTYTFADYSANGTGTGAGTLNFGGGITGGAAGNTVLTLAGSNTNANTISGVIANGTATSLALTKSGIGTWVLSGANTYTGATTLNGGTLAVSFGTVSANILPSASALTLGSGTLSLTGTGTQTVNGLTTTASTGNNILLSTNETLTLGALTSVGANSALNFNTVTGGANATTSTIGTAVIVLTGQTAGSAINSGFTVSDAGGFGLATVNASNEVVRLTTTTLLPASGATSATNYLINNNAGGTSAAGSSGLAVSASESANSITVDTTAASGVVTLNSGVVLSNNTWNFGGNGSNTWQITGSTSGAGLKAATSGANINFNNYNTGSVTINSPILANGANLVSIFGTGTLIFSKANTYTGGTTVAGGTLQLPSGGSISGGNVTIGTNSAAALNIAGGSVTDSSGYIGYNAGSSGTATVSTGSWNNTGIVTSALYVGYGGTGVLNLTGSGTVAVTSGSRWLTIGANAGSSGTLNLGTGGVAGTLNASVVNGGSGTTVVNFNHTGSYTFAPDLYGSLSVNQLGAGTTILTNSNGYTGPTTISAGQVIATNASALGYGAVTVATGAGLSYFAGTDTPLGLGSTLAITGGSGTVLGGSVGSTATSAEIKATGAASASGAVQVNIFAVGGATPLAGMNNYTLLTGGAGSSLNGATYSLGTVYGNTNFTVGGFTSTATTLQVGITSATPIANAYWVGGLGGATNVWAASNGSTASNWATTAGGTVQGLVPGAGTNVIISATSPVTAPVATVLGANMSIAGLTIADTVNGLGLNADGSVLTVGASGITMNASIPASTIAPNVVLGSSQTWINNSANTLTVSGVVSGNSSLTKDGTGTIILSGANTYTGATTINGGTLQLGSTSAIGNNSAVTMANVAGATLNLAGFNTQISSLTGGGSLGGNIALGSATLTVQSNNNSPATYAGVISGSGGALTKIGIGALTLTGASTYTGQTTVSGPLVLAFGSVATNILPSASQLLLKSSTLSLSGTGTQTVNSLSINSGSNVILLGVNQTLNLGYLSGQTINSALNFNTAAGGANATISTVGTGVIVLTGQTPGNAINSGFTDLTVADAGGFGLATVNASNQVVRLTTTTLLPASGAASPTNYLINNNAGGASTAGSSSLAVSASESASSITVDTTAASGVATLNSGVVLSSNTWNFGGVGSNSWQITGSASGAGLQSVASGNTISFANYNTGAVTISSPILANGSNAVNIYGTGTLIFAGANTYTGTTTISGGTLQISTGGTINASSGSASIFVGSSSGDNATLNITGGSVTCSTGYLAYSAGSSGTATVSSGSWTMSSGLEIGGSGIGILNLSGGTISTSGSDLAEEPNSSGTATITGGTWTESSQLNIGQYGTGILNIAGGNVSSPTSELGSFAGSSGTASVSAGTWTNSTELDVGELGTGVLNITGGSVSSLTAYLGDFGGSSGTVTVSGGIWTNSSSLYVGYGGTGVLNLTGSGEVTINSGVGTLTLGLAGGAGTLNLGTGGAAGTLLAGSVTGGSSTAVVNFNQTGSYTFAPKLTGSLSVNKLGAGRTTLTATNTYTGATTVSGGTLAVNGSIASSSGVSVAQGATLSGDGSVSIISGSGLVAPGDPEILTGKQVDPSGGLSFAFSLTQPGSPTYGNAGASGNDVLHLTGASPFVFALTAANTVTVDFSGATLLPGQTYLGGFFTDVAVSDAMENQATFDYTGTNGAVVQYEGLVTEPSAAFATGTVTNGKVMEFQITPEPGSAALLLIGAGALLGWRRRRRV